jgi:hypothetical protein
MTNAIIEKVFHWNVNRGRNGRIHVNGRLRQMSVSCIFSAVTVIYLCPTLIHFPLEVTNHAF